MCDPCLHLLSGTKGKIVGQHLPPFLQEVWRVCLQAAGVAEVQLCRTGVTYSQATTHLSVFCAAGEAPVPTGRGSLIPQSYASAAPFVPQSLRQQQPAPASAAPQSSHQQLSYHQQHQWHSVPQSTPDALQVPHEEQQQPAAQAAPFVPQAARQQQHQPELQAGPAAPQSSHPQLEQQLPPQGWEPAQAPHHHQHGPANLQAATPAQQLPLPPGQGQVLAGQSIGQPMGQPMGMAGQYMLTQYVAGQSLPTAGQSVAQTMAQSMAQSMGMTVEGMLAYNLAYQEQLRRQQLGARAAAERALKDLQERRQQGLQQGNPQGSAVQGMDGQGVQQVGAVPCAGLAREGMVQQRPPGCPRVVCCTLLPGLTERLKPSWAGVAPLSRLGQSSHEGSTWCQSLCAIPQTRLGNSTVWPG